MCHHARVIALQPDASSSQEKPGRRIVLTGMVGIILPVALLAWAALMTRLFPNSSQCGEYTGCVGYLVQAWEVGRWVAIVLAWPLLHLLRVRPSWPVAILAALFLTDSKTSTATSPPTNRSGKRSNAIREAIKAVPSLPQAGATREHPTQRATKPVCIGRPWISGGVS